MVTKRMARLLAMVRAASTGQTMTEYALILAAVAIVVYVGYQTMGQDITSLIGSVDSQI